MTPKLLLISVCTALLNVVLNLVIIPKYGSAGAAITTTASYLFYCFLSWFLGRNLLRLRIDTSLFLRVLFNSAIMGIVLIFLKARFDNSIVGTLSLILIGSLIYGGIGVALKLHKVLEIQTEE